MWEHSYPARVSACLSSSCGAVLADTVQKKGQLESSSAHFHARLARPAGVEPTTLGFGNQYSIQLSYGRFERRAV
jgi:hypothetical protein